MLLLISVVKLILLTGGYAASIGVWKRGPHSNQMYVENSEYGETEHLRVSFEERSYVFSDRGQETPFFAKSIMPIPIDAESHENSKPIVFLTVSSLASKTENDRILELNWDKIPQDSANQDAWIRMYDRDPLQGEPEHLVSVRPTSEGYHRTSVRFPPQNFQAGHLVDACLGFWIAFVQNNETLASNCIRSRPNWMHQASSVIGNLSLLDIMIPGTHNTGTYAVYDKRDDTIFSRYLVTQEENVFNQLAFGIRYLDLRVAYQTSSFSDEKFWITHSSFVTDVTVREVVRQVKDFLDKTNEIVIMDFHRFTNGFKGRRASAPKRHQELIALLEEEVGGYMIPVSYTSWATLNTLWATGKRLYVGYADDTARRQSPVLFPAVKQLWGDVDAIQTLKSYLSMTVCRERNRRLTSAMAQLTPTTAGAIFDLYGGLRTMADQVNREVTKWFRDEWSQCANIVATDFFLGNNVIEVAVETNQNKQIP